MNYWKTDWITDERGSLLEAFKFPHDGQVFVVSMHKGSTRGNHVHHRKTEYFLCIYGSCMLYKQFREQPVAAYELDSLNPEVQPVFPGQAHKLYCDNEDGAIVLVWVNEVFNPEYPDTEPKEVYL